MVIAIPATRELFNTRLPGRSLASAYASAADVAAKQAKTQESQSDTEKARAADLVFRTVRAAMLGGIAQAVVVAALLATTTTLPFSVCVVIAVGWALAALVALRRVERTYREQWVSFRDPVTGRLAIPGEREPVARRVWLITVGPVAFGVLVLILKATHTA